MCIRKNGRYVLGNVGDKRAFRIHSLYVIQNHVKQFCCCASDCGDVSVSAHWGMYGSYVNISDAKMHFLGRELRWLKLRIYSVTYRVKTMRMRPGRDRLNCSENIFLFQAMLYHPVHFYTRKWCRKCGIFLALIFKLSGKFYFSNPTLHQKWKVKQN